LLNMFTTKFWQVANIQAVGFAALTCDEMFTLDNQS
jgi:hypothetical protein